MHFTTKTVSLQFLDQLFCSPENKTKQLHTIPAFDHFKKCSVFWNGAIWSELFPCECDPSVYHFLEQMTWNGTQSFPCELCLRNFSSCSDHIGFAHANIFFLSPGIVFSYHMRNQLKFLNNFIYFLQLLYRNKNGWTCSEDLWKRYQFWQHLLVSRSFYCLHTEVSRRTSCSKLSLSGFFNLSRTDFFIFFEGMFR